MNASCSSRRCETTTSRLPSICSPCIPPGTSDKTLVSKLILTTERATGAGHEDRPRIARLLRQRASRRRRNATRGRASCAESRTDQQISKRRRRPPTPRCTRPWPNWTTRARVDKLAGLLHWERALPADAGKPTPLAECLRGVAPAARRALVAAYWTARESRGPLSGAQRTSRSTECLSATITTARTTPTAWPRPACDCRPSDARLGPPCWTPKCN